VTSEKCIMILVMRFFIKVDHCFPIMSYDDLAYYLRLMPLAIFYRFIIYR